MCNKKSRTKSPPFIILWILSHMNWVTVSSLTWNSYKEANDNQSCIAFTYKPTTYISFTLLKLWKYFSYGYNRFDSCHLLQIVFQWYERGNFIYSWVQCIRVYSKENTGITWSMYINTKLMYVHKCTHIMHTRTHIYENTAAHACMYVHITR